MHCKLNLCLKIIELSKSVTAFVCSQFDDDGLENLDIAQLDITSQEDYILDEAAGSILVKVLCA